MCFLARVSPERVVTEPRAVARGNHQAVLAAARGAEVGEMVIHNHPSGTLEPSNADLAIAARVYEEGLGAGIIDNEARRLYVVVEPPPPRTRDRLDPAELDELLAPGGALSSLYEGYEDRPGQRKMLGEVVQRYNDGGVSVVEAGTGTGKSLAYLLPAALWAVRNGERTVVSTNTINLQEQLDTKDLPMVERLLGEEEELSWALVKGRGNYVSIRRLLLAAQSPATLFEDDRSAETEALVAWSRTTSDGSLSDLSKPPSPEVWDEVRSDGDICMGTRCPHFQACFFQRARRSAASAEVLVVNHALLFADVALRRDTENWSRAAVLPPYRHVILDEGHNVEDAATSHLGTEVTRVGIFRALGRLERGGKGILKAVEEGLAGEGSGGEGERLLARVEERVRPAVRGARESVVAFFDALEPRVPAPEEGPLRLGRGDPRDPSADHALTELLRRLTGDFGRLRREVEELRCRIQEDEFLADRLAGRILDLQSLERKLDAVRLGLGRVLDPHEDGDEFVRWIEGRGAKGRRNVIFAAAPVEPGPLLRESVFREMETVIVTSATLSTGVGPTGEGDFRFIRRRLGLDSPEAGSTLAIGASALLEEPSKVGEMFVPSPFDYGVQAVFGVPSDFPPHDAGRPFQSETARVTGELAEITGGGIFVLFTSHRALREVAGHLRAAGIESRWPLLVQGEMPRSRLLTQFTRSGRAILLGTTSFWEGVDVPGRPLRGLILQKLPFRVPTEPITQARMEAIEARGKRAFPSYLVPLATLRLKQGFGRLIRSRKDHGAVLLLDRRILTRSYGRSLRRALPDAPFLKGPWPDLRRRLEAFYGAGPGV